MANSRLLIAFLGSSVLVACIGEIDGGPVGGGDPGGGGGGGGGGGPLCGNRVVEGSEGCDDGNTAPGDGCSATCGVEGAPQRLTAAVDKPAISTELYTTNMATLTLTSS